MASQIDVCSASKRNTMDFWLDPRFWTWLKHPMSTANLHIISNPYAQDHRSAAATANYPINFFDDEGHVRRSEDIETDLFRLAIVKNGGCVRKAAAELRIGRSTFYRKLASSR